MKQNRDSRVYPYIHIQWTLDKGTKATEWGKVVFSSNGVRTIGYSYVKIKKEKKKIWSLPYSTYKN